MPPRLSGKLFWSKAALDQKSWPLKRGGMVKPGGEDAGGLARYETESWSVSKVAAEPTPPNTQGVAAWPDIANAIGLAGSEVTCPPRWTCGDGAPGCASRVARPSPT